MDEELVYRIALTAVPRIGNPRASALLQHFGSATAVFCATNEARAAVDGVGELAAREIGLFRDFPAARAEAQFVQDTGTRVLAAVDAEYPRRLLECYDAPTLLYYRGTADLNAARVVAMVGTRSHTDYGRTQTERLVQGLADHGVLIVSGLAFGIDGIAHRAALAQGLNTVGVLGHGFDHLYPPGHEELSARMTTQGGLLTEFRRRVPPQKHHFPVRNRIVAGMADACIVVETHEKGGSLITAELAGGYNREVFAIPGRNNDRASRGCLQLIRRHRACLLMDAAQLLDSMGWPDATASRPRVMAAPNPPPDEQEQKVIDALRGQPRLQTQELVVRTGLGYAELAGLLLALEISGTIAAHPGNRYSLKAND